MSAPSLVWLRRDLRLHDNPALASACTHGRPVVCLYLLDDDAREWRPGGASRWWLHGSLAALARALAARGGRLVLRRGSPETVLPALVRETGAPAVFWNRRYEPWNTARDARLKAALTAHGIEVRSFQGDALWEPREIATGSGRPFRIFTPFARACRAAGEPGAPLPAPARVGRGGWA